MVLFTLLNAINRLNSALFWYNNLEYFVGEVLRGDRIVNTPYEVVMNDDITCKLLCHSKDTPMNWKGEEESRVINRIKHDYTVHL